MGVRPGENRRGKEGEEEREDADLELRVLSLRTHSMLLSSTLLAKGFGRQTLLVGSDHVDVVVRWHCTRGEGRERGRRDLVSSDRAVEARSSLTFSDRGLVEVSVEEREGSDSGSGEGSGRDESCSLEEH